MESMISTKTYKFLSKVDNGMGLEEVVTFLIPTLNERDGIGLVIDEIKSLGFNKILVVDGNSTDGTAEIAKEKGAKVIYQQGKGKALAVMTGLKHVDTPYVAVIDGDYTYNPADVIKALKIMEDYDEVIVVRGNRKNIPLLNRFGNWVITKTFNLLFGTRLKDVLSGFYVLRTDEVKGVNFEAEGFSIEVAISAYLASHSKRIGEVIGDYRARKGESKLKKVHGFKILFDTILLAAKYNPVFLIFVVGSVSLLPGIAVLSYVALDYLVYHVFHFVLVFIGFSLFNVGLISLLLSVLALYLKRMEYRLNEKIEGLKRDV
jgi:Glycosyltransferases involved in cell wall biogenesis